MRILTSFVVMGQNDLFQAGSALRVRENQKLFGWVNGGDKGVMGLLSAGWLKIVQTNYNLEDMKKT